MNAKLTTASKKSAPATKKAAVKTATKAATKAAKKAIPKAAPKVATKVAAKVATKVAAKVATKAVDANLKQTKTKPLPAAGKAIKIVAEKGVAGSSNTGAATRNDAPKSLRSNKATAGSAGKIHDSVVSKVSNVATNTKTPISAVSDGTLLTEAQIMKMGEQEYMNPAQLAFFKARLQQLEKDLLKNAGETTEHLRETVLVPDPADRATIEEEHALELRTRDRERKLLKKVQQSIASIDSGDYGWCEETGEPIGIPRLLARPTATLSLEAQQRRELKQKLYGD
jgi:DnaK suppressor protein